MCGFFYLKADSQGPAEWNVWHPGAKIFVFSFAGCWVTLGALFGQNFDTVTTHNLLCDHIPLYPSFMSSFMAFFQNMLGQIDSKHRLRWSEIGWIYLSWSVFFARTSSDYCGRPDLSFLTVVAAISVCFFVMPETRTGVLLGHETVTLASCVWVFFTESETLTDLCQTDFLSEVLYSFCRYRCICMIVCMCVNVYMAWNPGSSPLWCRLIEGCWNR